MHMYDRHMHRHTQTLAYQHAVSQLGICQYISYFEKIQILAKTLPICEHMHMHATTCTFACTHMQIYEHTSRMRTHEHTHIQTH